MNPKVLRELSRGPRDLGCTLCLHRRKEGEERIKRGNRRMEEKERREGSWEEEKEEGWKVESRVKEKEGKRRYRKRKRNMAHETGNKE